MCSGECRSTKREATPSGQARWKIAECLTCAACDRSKYRAAAVTYYSYRPLLRRTIPEQERQARRSKNNSIFCYLCRFITWLPPTAEWA